MKELILETVANSQEVIFKKTFKILHNSQENTCAPE